MVNNLVVLDSPHWRPDQVEEFCHKALLRGYLFAHGPYAEIDYTLYDRLCAIHRKPRMYVFRLVGLGDCEYCRVVCRFDSTWERLTDPGLKAIEKFRGKYRYQNDGDEPLYEKITYFEISTNMKLEYAEEFINLLIDVWNCPYHRTIDSDEFMPEIERRR